ncbi:MAG: 3',5'-cyclic-nucleotide phosphodiesterase [Planctomycetota bacterium]
MRIRILGNAGEVDLGSFATSFLVDETLAVDAGSLGFALPLAAQRRVTDVLITHAHLDHVCSLPIFLENVYEPDGEPVRIHAHRDVAAELRRHLFNDRIWPDFERLSSEGHPFLEFREFAQERPFRIGEIEVTPLSVIHTVRCFGFLLRKGDRSALIVGDTAPTRRIWERARTAPGLSHVFLEASFPDRLAAMAQTTKHLTPSRLREEKAKVGGDVKVIAYHLKARYADEIAAEIRALGDPAVEVARTNEDYSI